MSLFSSDFRKNKASIARHKRRFSNSLWHVDWHRLKEPRWGGHWLLAYEDDASRFITGFAVSDCLTAELHAQVLQGSVKRYGRPVTLIASYDSTFCSVESMKRDGGITELEKFILKNKIRLVLSVVRRRASGKIDKFFSLLESVANYFSSMEEFATWYNCVRPHGGIGLKTPLQAYYQRLPQADMIAFPPFMENEPSGKLFL